MVESLFFLKNILSNPLLLLTVKTAAFCIKAIIFGFIIKNLLHTQTTKRLWVFIAVSIASMLVINASWIVFLLKETQTATITPFVKLFFSRLSWPFVLLQYVSFLLFLDHLINKKIKLNFKPYYALFFITISLLFCIIAYELSHIATQNIHDIISKIAFPLFYFYVMIGVLPAIFMVIIAMRRTSLPKILNHQLRVLIGYLIMPHLFLELITINPLAFFNNMPFRSNYMLISISTVQLTYAIYYCTRKMIQLRFLNNKKQVISHDSFDFIKDFKEILDQLSHVVSANELGHITQNFFKSAFNIPFNKIRLYIRTLEKINMHISPDKADTLHIYIEDFFNKSDSSDIKNYLYNTKILIKDEIEFSYFYDDNNNLSALLSFLQTINASVFLPLYEKQTLVGYIIIEQGARKNLFTNVDQDEMIVFGGYLANTMNLLRTSNINQLIKTNKELTEDLYNKHQEIQQYKESIRSFLKGSHERKIGILFYKNRRFSYGNQIAQELLPVDINQEEGTPLVKSLKHIARTVLEYKIPQTITTKDHNDKKLVISAIPSLDEHYIILTVHHPEMSDIIKLQRDLLKDPSSLDYLLYLETTKSGQLINNLIPGSGEVLLNFKINLLRMALNKKAIVLEMADEDLLPAVEILHNISLRTKLHILTLTHHEKNYETAFKLFGANPLFGTNHQEPLLEKLDNIGTLFIKNIDYLNFETQEYLSEFLTYGFFHTFKGDKKIFSNVRIICSTSKPLQETALSRNLLTLLEKAVLTLPPFISLPKNEILDLADRFIEQIVPANTVAGIFLNDKEKEQLMNQNPVSITEFKELIQRKIVGKSTINETYHDSINTITDPEIARIVRLGKKALKDPMALQLLWKNFKSESKIATLLGVNRSSINRRRKEYQINEE